MAANLALILFLPWFAILAALYWFYPRHTPVTPARRRFDVAVLVLAFALSLLAGRYGFGSAEPGPIWKQVLATLYAYKSFLAVIAVAWWYRGRRFPAVPADRD